MGDALPALDFSGRQARLLRVGSSSGAAILDNGTIALWGSDLVTVQVAGTTKPRLLQLPPGRVVRDIQLAPLRACVLYEDGGVTCWGEGARGQLGQGIDTRFTRPNAADVDLGGRRATQLSMGFEHNCVVVVGDEVLCWGANYGGQLGLDDDRSRGLRLADLGASLPSVKLR